MQNKTFEDALELAYAECWRQGDELDKIEKGEIKYGDGGEADQTYAYDSHWREAIGGVKVLAILLNAQGLIGKRAFPVDPDNARPCSQQAWIRLMQWGISKGLTTQAELDKVIEESPQHAAALKNLGKDVPAPDFRALIAERNAVSST